MSIDVRNRHERADTVLVVPLTTSIHKNAPTNLMLAAGATGLQVESAARAENENVDQIILPVVAREGAKPWSVELPGMPPFDVVERPLPPERNH